MDRESRDPLYLLDEIEKTLALDTAPVTWPIGRGRSFAGTYDLAHDRVRRIDADEMRLTPRSGVSDRAELPLALRGPGEDRPSPRPPAEDREAFREEASLAREAC